MAAKTQFNYIYLIAFAVAGLVILLASLYAEQRVSQAIAKQPIETRIVVEELERMAVVVAQRDLVRGQIIDNRDLTLVKIPVEAVNRSGYFTDKELLIGLTLRRDILAGEWLVNRHFQDFEADDTDLSQVRFSETLTEGRRAFRVPVTSQTGLLGLLNAGDFVDILGRYQDPDTDQLVSRTFLQNVEVLRVGQAIPAAIDNAGEFMDTERSLLTLNLTLPEAELLNLALGAGPISMLLRNPADLVMTDSAGQRLTDLARQAEPITPVPEITTDPSNERPASRVIQVIMGGKIEEVTIQ
jgi:pilus assembly protein CpaB